jgi:hypothetical protein
MGHGFYETTPFKSSSHESYNPKWGYVLFVAQP